MRLGFRAQKKRPAASEPAIRQKRAKALTSSSDAAAPVLGHFKAVYKVIDRMHEPIPPVGSDEHSITGNVTAGSFFKLVTRQQELPSEYQLDATSVYLDVGSGMGRPTLCMATLPISLSVGIEVQEEQVKMSLLALKKLSTAQASEAPVLIEHCDVMRVASLEPVTHVHMFLWANPALLRHAASLLAWSKTLKVMTIIYRGTPSDLRDLGILESLQDTDNTHTQQISMQMPGQHSYGAYVLCMTPERRQRMRAMLPKPKTKEGASEIKLTKMIEKLKGSRSEQAKFMAGIESKIAHRGVTLRSKRTLSS